MNDDKTTSHGTMIMFPGQGAQKQGMCLSMKDSLEAQQVFDRAEKILGYNILDICIEGGDNLEEQLKSTAFVQVALLVSCLAKLEQIKVENPDKLANVTHVAGVSLGEITALVYSEVISFEDAVRIVEVRGRVMEEDSKKSATGMALIFGFNCEKLQRFLVQKYPNIIIAGYFADEQSIVAGTNSDLDDLVTCLYQHHKDDRNFEVRRNLRVAGAFHTRHMENSFRSVKSVIESVRFNKPNIPLIMNVTGEFVDDPEIIKKLICDQIVSPVLWKQSMITAYEDGVRKFIEVTPTRFLTVIAENKISALKNCTVDLILV